MAQYYTTTLNDAGVMILSDEVPLDTQFIIQKSEIENFPSTSAVFLVDDFKNDPDINLPPSELQEMQQEEIIEEQSVDVYEVSRNAQGELEVSLVNENFFLLPNSFIFIVVSRLLSELQDNC